MAGSLVRPVGSGTLELLDGDLTELELDAIVNPANQALQLGGGVAGAIRRKGGPSIQQECDRIGECPVGQAVITGAGDLPARHVIHTVGPVWNNHPPEECDRLLASACRESLALARDRGLSSVGLPSISTGIFGYPVERAARILLGEAIGHLRRERRPGRVVFCLFGEDVYGVYERALAELPPEG